MLSFLIPLTVCKHPNSSIMSTCTHLMILSLMMTRTISMIRVLTIIYMYDVSRFVNIYAYKLLFLIVQRINLLFSIVCTEKFVPSVVSVWYKWASAHLKKTITTFVYLVYVNIIDADAYQIIRLECPSICSKKNGLVRDSNPGPLAPKARIIPLDQRAAWKHCRDFKYLSVSSYFL